MPLATREGASLRYETAGDGETVAFVGELGYGAWQWGWQHRAAAGPYESVVPAMRGSSGPGAPPGPYALADLADDVEAVLADAGGDRAHLVGLGLGGLVALRYALDHSRARSLMLVGTSVGGEHVPDRPVDRLYAPRDDPAALRATLEPVLTAEFRRRQPDVVDGIVRWRAGDELEPDGQANAGPESNEHAAPGTGNGSDGFRNSVDDAENISSDADSGGTGGGGEGAEAGEWRAGDAGEAGWRAQAAALEGVDLADRLHEVTLPALVVHGTADALWPLEGGRRLAEALPRGRFVPIEGGPHLVTVERSRAVNDHLLGFLDKHAGGRDPS